ncbi:TetR/AcrR family transcriptional regulator [Cupriavidus pauculus]|uniref:TetR/AcrR family transcriptional regulator n=1 Tax=Cupriavidus pauculus TaxID=82633 RepID=UPI000785C7CA|nr:TetR/AcrR family transcriptional regulator [Cupriavidus pauculus]
METTHTADPVLSRKAKATRTALLDAARLVIERDGYVNARIADIAQQAGKSTGVFYTYFKDKTELFAALVDAFHDDLKRMTPSRDKYEENIAPAVRQTVSVFWMAYRKFHPEFLGLLEVAPSDPALLEVWREIRKRGIRRFAFRVRRQQALGKCEGLDPELTASALHGMLEFTCFNWHSRKIDYPGVAVEDDDAIETLYRIIARTLELDD